jgi:hypothetical protein
MKAFGASHLEPKNNQLIKGNLGIKIHVEKYAKKRLIT